MAASLKTMPGDGLAIKARGNGVAGAGKGAIFSIGSPDPSVMEQTGLHEGFSDWNELLRLGQRFMEKFTTLLPEVLEDRDPESVHKVRVVCRRLEQILWLIYAKPQPAYARKLRKRIKRCRQMLGDLADCDILMKMANRSLARAPASGAAAWHTLAQFIQQRREKILPRVVGKVSQIEFSTPYARLRRGLKKNGVRPHVYHDGKFQKLTPEKAEKLIQQRIVDSLAHLWRDFESLVEESHDDPCEQVIHGLRIATKRLRHMVEIMKNLGTPGASEVLPALRALQKALGRWHDMEVLEQVTSELLVQKKFVRDHLELAIEIEQLFLRNREIKRSSEEKFRLMTVNSRDYREIKTWVAENLPGRFLRGSAAGNHAPSVAAPLGVGSIAVNGNGRR